MGGGIYLNGSQTVTITGTGITGNMSTLGGGIYCMSLIISNSVISSNTAPTRGGGIHCQTLTISNCQISSNSSNIGSGIYYINQVFIPLIKY
jgi:predicted outer membrane repeat protein